ncbi:hypothetical protein FRC11_007099 [Ceratobasidium sp. 423]|nr:hypothetical protein FRC11_007099 [Ceratobasidium sp. 423]
MNKYRRRESATPTGAIAMSTGFRTVVTSSGVIQEQRSRSVIRRLAAVRFHGIGRLSRSGEIKPTVNCYANGCKAIDYRSKALELTPKGHEDKARRFEVASIRASRAIEYQMQAIELTPEGHASRPSFLSELGYSWRRRFERLDDLADVNNAIQRQEQAVQLTPEGDPEKPVVLLNIGCSLSSRFGRLKRPADIDKAIEHQAEAVQLIPNDHPNKQVYLNSLGHSCARRFAILNEFADLDKAIKYQTLAVELTPEGHPDKARNPSDLEKQIEFHAQAVRLTPEGHQGKPTHLLNLGNSWVGRFALLRQRADLESARISFQHGAELIITCPETHIGCARQLS